MMKKTISVLAFVLALTLSITAFFALSAYAEKNVSLAYSDVFTEGENCKTPVSDYEFNVKGHSGNGVFFEGEGETFSFKYNNKIPVGLLSKNLQIINMVPVSGEGYDKISSAEFILRDSENPDNRVGIYFTYAGYINEHNVIYVIGDNNGDYRAVSLGGNGTEYFSGKMFGYASYSNSLNPEVMYSSFNFSLDYASKTLCFYDSAVREILCMTDRKQVGAGIWEGFSSGCATLEVVINTFKGGKAGVVVEKMFGESVGGEVTSQNNKPVIYFENGDYDLSDMPVAEKGTKYVLPKAYAFDRFTGESEIKITAENGGEKNTITGNSFIPGKSGEYTVSYIATNDFGTNEPESKITVRVNENLPQYNVWLKNETAPVIDEYYEVPEVYVAGGSGTLTLALRVRYNENEFATNSGEHLFIDEAGILILYVTVKGYTGEEYTQGFYYEIAGREIPFTVSAVPEYALKGEDLLLPEPEIRQAGLSVEVGVGGAKLSEGNFVVPAEKVTGESLKVTYSSKDGKYKRDYEIKIISPENREDFMIAVEGAPEISLSERKGIKISVPGGEKALARMPFAMPLEDFLVTVITEGSGADSADIILRDAQYGITAFLRLSYKDGESSYVQLNGTGEKVAVNGGFGKNSQISLMINARKKTVSSSTGNVLFDNIFIPSGIAYISFGINGSGSSDFALTVRQLANQLLYASDAARLVYGKEPVTSGKEVSFGGIIKLPSVLLYDVFDNPKKGYAKVTSLSGETVYYGSTDGTTIEVNEYGYYYLDYYAEEGAKKADASFTFAVADEISPVIKIGNGVPVTAETGKTYTLPSVTVTDNVDENPTWYALIYNPKTCKRAVISEGTYSFSEAGEYRIIFFAMDKAGNVTVIELGVTVK